MKIQSNPDLHLTYCLNIHPGETLEDVTHSIKEYAARVKLAVCPDRPFGLGIRLSAAAALALSADELEDFKAVVEGEGMYVFTVNGFPYGEFHGTRVKENVYSPDWQTDERRIYTEKLVSILGGLLPDGVDGSISTVPVSYGSWIQSDAEVLKAVCQLVRVVKTCMRFEQESGKLISLALEPEPDCCLQNMDGVTAFFNDHLLLKGSEILAAESGMSGGDSEAAIRRYTGVCFDTCHSAVEFEDPFIGLSRLAMEGVNIPKIQISSAVSAIASNEAGERLKAFIDPVYFHQTRVRGKRGEVVRYPDLNQELLDNLEDGSELRTHFHVPLWFEGQGGLNGTAGELSGEFFDLIKSGLSTHIETETYTFNVLPDELRSMDVVESVVRELQWVEKRLGGTDES